MITTINEATMSYIKEICENHLSLYPLDKLYFLTLTTNIVNILDQNDYIPNHGYTLNIPLINDIACNKAIGFCWCYDKNIYPNSVYEEMEDYLFEDDFLSTFDELLASCCEDFPRGMPIASDATLFIVKNIPLVNVVNKAAYDSYMESGLCWLNNATEDIMKKIILDLGYNDMDYMDIPQLPMGLFERISKNDIVSQISYIELCKKHKLDSSILLSTRDIRE